MPDEVPQLIPNVTEIGHAPLLSTDGVEDSVIARLVVNDEPVLIVGWLPQAARRVAMAMLVEVARLQPPQTQPTKVLGRFPGGTNPVAAVREVGRAMFEDPEHPPGPLALYPAVLSDPQGRLPVHLSDEHGARLDLAGLTAEEMHALHRALHDEGGRHAG